MQNRFVELFDRHGIAAVPARQVRDAFLRLDASYYYGTGANTRRALTQGRLEIKPLSEIATVEQPTVFGKRFMQGGKQYGIPLYAASEILNHSPATDTYLARRLSGQFESLLAQPGTLLLSRSGSVGRPALVPSWMAGIAIQDDAFRITAADPRIPLYLYAYFMSAIGQPLLTGTAFGSVIQHIKVDHIRQVPVIVPNEGTLDRVATLMATAERSRGVGRQVHEEAVEAIHMANHLPPIQDIRTSWLDPEHSIESFLVNKKAVINTCDERSGNRLDAHFYNPTAQLAVANIEKCGSEVKTVGDVSKQVLMGPCFKRNYVEAAHGVPFLSGKNIVQIRPDLKYLSKNQMADMQELLVKRGWTLITCSGTIGRTCFVWKNYEDYAASQHILRVIPDESQIDAGYLYAFLSSRYGYEQILRYRHGSVIDEVRHGSVIDEVTDTQIEQVLVPLPSQKDQIAIGDKVRMAYEKRAEAVRLEDEAQSILMKELTKAPGVKGK